MHSSTLAPTSMSNTISLLFVVGIAIGFGGAVHAQPVPPPLVGDISIDRNDATPLEAVRKLIAPSGFG